MPSVIKLITWEKYIDNLIDAFIGRYGNYHSISVKHIKNTDFYIVEITVYGD